MMMASATQTMSTVDEGHVGKGLVIGLLLQVLIVPVFPLVGLISIVQFAYIGPTVVYFRRRHEMATVKGLWIAAAIVAALSVACWGAVFTFGPGDLG